MTSAVTALSTVNSFLRRPEVKGNNAKRAEVGSIESCKLQVLKYFNK